MQGFLGIEVLLVVFCLTLYILFAEYLEKRKIEYINESTLAIFLGLIIGSVILLMGGKTDQFSSAVVFYFLLPPIIFSAGYTLNTSSFFQNFSYISLYGLIGTFTSFTVISLMTVLFGQAGLSTKECLLLASILSATDTVAAITVIKENKYPRLHSVLFGEGVLNDAVSIVLYRTVENIGDDLGLWTSFEFLLSFLVSTFFSIGVGVGTGLLAAYVFKKNQDLQQHPEREVALIVLVGYLSYIFSELVRLSGIMAIFCCAVTMAYYTSQNTSKTSQQATGLIFTVMSQGAEAFTFTYLGMNLITFAWKDWNVGFSVYLLVAIVIGRAFAVFFNSFLVYFMKNRSFGLDRSSLCVIWYAGLIRGTIAIALALQIKSESQLVIVSTTLAISLFTTLFFSNFVSAFSRYVKLESSSSQKYFDLMPNQDMPDHYCLRIWSNIDKNYFQRWVGKEEKENDEMNSWKKVWDEEDVSLNQLDTTCNKLSNN
jgi:NhaP-type Na+/H+ or K+/H+ antiporter